MNPSLFRQVGHIKGNFRGKDDSSDISLAIYIQLFIYALKTRLVAGVLGACPGPVFSEYGTCSPVKESR